MMKKLLIQTWWIYGAVSTLCMALCPQVGWYAIANLLVLLTAFWVVSLAAKHYKRLVENREILRRMSKKQKKAFEAADEKEIRSIAASSKMMTYLCFGSLLLNAYTYYYAIENDKLVMLSDQIPLSAGIWLLVAGILTGVVFYAAFCFKMNSLLDFS